MLGRLVSHGARGIRVRRLGGDRAGEIRFTRFLRNASASLSEMIGSAFARTQAACADRDILAIQDTTVTRSSGGGGDYLHAMIAVDAGSGVILGALDAQFLERTEGGKASRKRRVPQDRQSARWRACADTAGQIEGAARVTVVADREADIFDLFAHRPAHVDLLVRATHNRALEDGGRLAARIGDEDVDMVSICLNGIDFRAHVRGDGDQDLLQEAPDAIGRDRTAAVLGRQDQLYFHIAQTQGVSRPDLSGAGPGGGPGHVPDLCPMPCR